MTVESFRQALNRLAPEGMPLIAAVSGGVDSMCLAELLTRISRPFVIAHCNFKLRGDESDEDCRFVESWAANHSIQFRSISFDTGQYASAKGISIEMAARELRYEWFARLSEEAAGAGIAIAHNSNDNAETLFLNLLRGTGGRGMRGISPAVDKPCPIIRPLLEFSREEIMSWMKENGCSWREDRTNSDTVYKRNLIRHKIFPVLSSINPAFLETLNKDMKYFSQENDIAEEYFITKKSALTDDDGSIRIDSLLNEKHWEYLLFRLTENTGINSAVLESLIEAIKDGRQLTGKQFGPLYLSRGRIFTKAEGFTPNVEIQRLPRPDNLKLKRNDGTLIMDARKFPEQIIVREWREGDWMIPLGMKGKKKLSDMFVDLKFSPADKKNARVIEYPGICGRVAALLCFRIDDTLKVTEDTAEIIQARFI